MLEKAVEDMAEHLPVIQAERQQTTNRTSMLNTILYSRGAKERKTSTWIAAAPV